MHMKLLDIATLANGTTRQKDAHNALKTIQLFELLASYSPVLAGAIPLDLETPKSAIEVICSTENLESFAQTLESLLGSHEAFELHHSVVNGRPAVLVSFRALGFWFHLLGQDVSVLTQPAVLLMLTEARLLAFAPKELRERVRALKEIGQSTEAAFASCLELSGDPTEELMKISRLTDREILAITHRFRFAPH